MKILKHLNQCGNRQDFLTVSPMLIFLWVTGYVRRVPNSGTWFEWLAQSTPKAWNKLKELEGGE